MIDHVDGVGLASQNSGQQRAYCSSPEQCALVKDRFKAMVGIGEV
jgi:hypothetical protein